VGQVFLLFYFTYEETEALGISIQVKGHVLMECQARAKPKHVSTQNPHPYSAWAFLTNVAVYLMPRRVNHI
jgi:hypothetical protein